MRAATKRAQRQFRRALDAQGETREQLFKGERIDFRDLTGAQTRVDRTAKRATKLVREDLKRKAAA